MGIYEPAIMEDAAGTQLVQAPDQQLVEGALCEEAKSNTHHQAAVAIVEDGDGGLVALTHLLDELSVAGLLGVGSGHCSTSHTPQS